VNGSLIVGEIRDIDIDTGYDHGCPVRSDFNDPAHHPDAVRYDTLTFQDVLSGELAVMDSTAIALCKDNSIPIVVFDLFGQGNIGRAVAGEPIGTSITPAG